MSAVARVSLLFRYLTFLERVSGRVSGLVCLSSSAIEEISTVKLRSIVFQGTHCILLL